jgi:hypothetical protein
MDELTVKELIEALADYSNERYPSSFRGAVVTIFRDGSACITSPKGLDLPVKNLKGLEEELGLR